MKKLTALIPLFLASVALAQSPPPASDAQGTRGPGVPEFWVRPGFKVTLAAENFGNARFLELAADGAIFVSQPNDAQITLLRDKDGDGVYETKSVFLTAPEYRFVHGLHVADDGYLYFTTPNAIYRTLPKGDKAGDIQTVISFNIPNATSGHWWRSIFVSNGYLYTSIGDPGNITDVGPSSEREKIYRFKVDPSTGQSSDKTVFCTGIRNTEKLRFRPGTTELYGCDHGSDNFGAKYGERGGGVITDVNPPCEFNHYIQGFFYGHPFVTGLGLPRPESSNRPDILQLVESNTPPAWCFGAHNAPNGWTFVKNPALLGVSGDALVALHGSWNSTKKVGYAIQRICFDPATGKPYGAMPLVKTLNAAGTQPLGRPVDLLELPDSSVLFSDDHTNKLYRITKE